jgi:hypothetical protein
MHNGGQCDLPHPRNRGSDPWWQPGQPPCPAHLEVHGCGSGAAPRPAARRQEASNRHFIHRAVAPLVHRFVSDLSASICSLKFFPNFVFFIHFLYESLMDLCSQTHMHESSFLEVELSIL